MSIPIPSRLRWTEHTGRLTADHGPIHILLERTVSLHISGLPDRLTSLDYWEPDRHGILRVGCEAEREMDAREAEACRSHFLRALELIAQVVRTWFGIDQPKESDDA